MNKLEEAGIAMTEYDGERCENLCRIMNEQLRCYGVPEGLVRMMVNKTITLGRMMGAEQVVRRDVANYSAAIERVGQTVSADNYRANRIALGIDSWN